jgi:predicted XRE-type DNA-binding protein
MSKNDLFPSIKENGKEIPTPTYISIKLKEYFTENGMKQGEIAEALDVTQSAVSNQLKGRPFGVNSAKKWSKTFGFSINWLTTGEGPMFEKRKPTNILKGDEHEIMRPKSHVNDEIPVIPAWMFRAPNTDIYKAVMEDPTVETLPAVPHFAKFDLYARCPGDAMYPKISRGTLMALAKVDKTAAISNGDIYAVDTVNQGMIIRRIRDNKDGTWTCTPVNQDQFQPFDIYRFDVLNVFRIVGLLVTNL